MDDRSALFIWWRPFAGAGFNYKNPALYCRDTNWDIILEKLMGQPWVLYVPKWYIKGYLFSK